MEEKPNYYAIIPANIRYDERLKDKAKLLYGEITSLSNKNGECWATNTYFAKLYKVKTQCISDLICELVKYGYIERKIIYKNNSKEIDKRILIPICQKEYTYMPNDIYPICQKDKENNININNINNNKKEINKENQILDMFEEFWQRYPKKINKAKCKEWYLKHKPTIEQHKQIIWGVTMCGFRDDWKKNEYKYTPYPTTFLNQKKWEDFINE